MRKSTPLHPMTIRPLGYTDGDVTGKATRYRLREVLHAGTLATVHLAQAQLAGDLVREVALKFPHGPSALPRAIAEARVYARVQGPAFGAFLGFVMADACAEPPRPMLVLERWQGVSLAALMREGGAPLGIDAASFVALSLFEALASLHESVEPASQRPAPVVHGAVFAENVFLTWDGQLKLHGLGGSRVLVDPDDGSAALRADVVAAQALVRGILEGRDRLRHDGDRFRDGPVCADDDTPDAGVLARASTAAGRPMGAIATRWTAREMAAAFRDEPVVHTGREALARALARNFDAPTVRASGVLRRAHPTRPEVDDAELAASADDTLVISPDQMESLVRDTQPTLPPPPEAPPNGESKARVSEPFNATPPPFIAATPPTHFAPTGRGDTEEASQVVLRRPVRLVLASAAAVWAVALVLGASRFRARSTAEAPPVDVRNQGPNGARERTTPAARTRAPERAVVPPGSGLLRLSASAAGHRIYVDGRLVAAGTGTLTIPCGRREVRVGRQGALRPLTVPCGGEVDLPR